MMGAWIFNDVYIGANFFQPCDVIAAWVDRHPVVGDAVIKPGTSQQNTQLNSSETAVRASAFSSGKPIEMRAQWSSGGKARPMSMPLARRAPAIS